MKFFKHRSLSILQRSISPLFIATFAFGALAGAAQAQEAVTVQGEIVDLACYMSKGSKGPQHRSCAQMCAKKGVPIGLLTDAGEVFLLVDDHDDPDHYDAAKKLAGERAEISGKKYAKGGMSTIVVGAAKGL